MNHFEKSPSPEPPETSSRASSKEAQANKPRRRQKTVEERRADYPDIFSNPNKREMYSNIEQFLEKIDIDEVQDIISSYGDNYKICSRKLISYLSSVLRVKNPPRVVFEPQDDSGEDGCYSYKDNTITIYYKPGRKMKINKEDIITAAHETWHARQSLLAYVYKSHPDSALYRRNIKYYIEAEEDFDGYKNQRFEWEAETFGQEFFLRFCTVESRQLRSRFKQLGRKVRAITS